MVMADLLLFEAVLLAASVTEEQSFDAVREAMVSSSYSGMYVSIVVLGFALKAGLWPLHYWLSLAYRSARPPVVVLLAGVPVAIGLLGIVRWLPLGEITLPAMAMIAQGLGAAAMVYVLLSGLIQRQLKALSAYVTIFATGLFVVGLGTVLRNPDVWTTLAHMVPVFIFSLSIGLALLTTAISWLVDKVPSLHMQEKQSDNTTLWFERWSGKIVAQGRVMGLDTLPRLRARCLATAESCLQIHAWKKALQTGEFTLQRWTLAITLLLLVAMTVVLLVVTGWKF
jgi:NADH:ubiquinone oxidoreductase subunit 4 (subunit M)